MNCPEHDIVLCPCANKGEQRFNHDEPITPTVSIARINVSSGEDVFFDEMERQVNAFLFPEYAEPQNYCS